MGEASRRAAVRREAAFAAKPVAQYAAQVPMVRTFQVDIPKSVESELRAEFRIRQRTYPKLTLRDYVGALVESAVERERQMREAQEAQAQLVVPATTEQVAKVLSRPATVGTRTPR